MCACPQRTVAGPKKLPRSWLVKPKGELRYNTGMKAACVMGGIGNGKVLMWQENTAGKWGAAAAASMYKKVLKKGLKQCYPKLAKKGGPFTILEDNDPSGYKSKAAVKAKKLSGMKVLEIPKRSPDLNPMDFRIWHEVNRRMRETEKGWKATKKETRDQYVARLGRTARGLPAAFVNSAVADMARRCKLVIEAKGGHFDESQKKKAAKKN